MAIISVNLAVLNLLPIPVLDGGHLMFLTIEALRGGKPVGIEQRLRFSQIGMLLVLGLMVWAFANDIMRLVGA
jgi:regulator of sigma E protease